MALVAQGYFLVVTFGDSSGDTTQRTYQMDVATDAAAAAAAAAAIPIIDAVTDAVIISYYWYNRFVEDGDIYPLTANTQNENQAILTFALEGSATKTATTSIPAASAGIFVGTTGENSKQVDTTDAAVIAFRELFQAAGDFFISDGEKVNVLKKGKRRHVKNNNG